MIYTGGSAINNQPDEQEMWVCFLAWEDPLEKEMANHSWVFFPGKSHEPRSLVGYSPWGHKRVKHDIALRD